jgi:hypothetical protein
VFVALLGAAGFLQFFADENWFSFAAEHARWLPKAIASSLITGAVLILLLPSRLAAPKNRT